MKKQNPARKRASSRAMIGMCALISMAISPAEAFADEPADTTETLPEIQVEGQTIRPASYSVDPDYQETAPYADGGEFLRSIPGVDSGRMGGHGFEPVIRGLQQNRLNVIGDGAFQYGACPNRMDPPTSLSSFGAYDEIIVERGYQTVTNGPGGSGGTIKMERSSPEFLMGNPYEGSLMGGYNSNGNVKEVGLGLAGDLGQGFARFDGGYKDAANYEDGRDNTVRSAYEELSGTLELGWRPDEFTILTLSEEVSRSRDVLFAGAGMDTPESDYSTTRFSMERAIDDDVLRRIDVSTFGSFADHLMDNYSLRSFGAMTMKTDSTSDTLGGRVAADLDVNDIDLTAGVDFQHNTRNATRFRGTTTENVDTVHAYMWPDLALMQAGVFTEGTMQLDPASRLTVGARYDYVNVDAGKVDKIANPTGAISRSANDLYALYYGKRMENVTEHNIGGLARYELDLVPGVKAHTAISRSVRTADATERGMAGDHGTAASRWVGNPDIEPEKHHQVELGATASTHGWDVEGSVYHDWVSDFIFRDRARGQDGILLSDNATVYRNVDARLWGIELGVNTRLKDTWVLSANAAYTRGRNDDTGLPLPQIPPLSGMIDLAYDHDVWTLGTRINAAMKQTRVDTDTATGSGLDVQKTPGYVVPNLYATYRGLDPFDIRFGISNLFDHNYANHLNRSNSFDTDQVQVNEPGRSFYLQARAEF